MLDKIWKVIRIIFAVAVLVGLILGGVVLYQSCRPEKPAQGEPPAESVAGYQVTIRSTGQRIFAEKVAVEGSPGYRVYTIESYWESNGKKYIIRKHPLVLDEKYFGIIEVKRR